MKQWARLAGLGLLLLGGCGKFFVPITNNNGGGTGNTTAGNVLYFMNTAAATISGYTVSTAGALTAVTNSPYAVGFTPTTMAISPKNTFLYVGYAAGVLGYSIGANGVLTVLNSGAAVTSAQLLPLSMQVDSTGTLLLVASEDLATTLPEIGVYQINTATGALTPITGSPLVLAVSGNGSTSGGIGNRPQQVYITPDNSEVYLMLGSGGTEVLTLNASTQVLTDTQTYLGLATGGTGQIEAIANATSTVLYLTEIGVGVHALSIGANGKLTDLTGSPYKTGSGPSGIALDGTGDYLYVTNKGDGTISGFSVGGSGTLTALAASPFTAGTLPLSLSLDQSKKFLAVANSNGNPDLGVYSFDATTVGNLDLVSSEAAKTVTGATLVVSTQ